MGDIFGKSSKQNTASVADAQVVTPEVPQLSSVVAPLPDASVASSASDASAVPGELSSEYVQQVLDAGKSLVVEMDLFSWWTPPSYFRYALEYLHFDVGLPWWGTVIAATAALRLLMIWVPIRAQRFSARFAPHMANMKEFESRLRVAMQNKDNLLGQQIIMDRSDYCKKHRISPVAQMGTLVANGFVFSTQFFAIEKMAKANFPGMSSGGTLWFENLVAADPLYILPALSAVTIWATTKYGMEFGSQQTIPPGMRSFLLYGMPPVVFVCSTQFPAAVCLYWCTSNFISLFYAALFSAKPVRKALGLPQLEPKTQRTTAEVSPWQQMVEQAKQRTKDLQTDAQHMARRMKEEDARRFKEAGQEDNRP